MSPAAVLYTLPNFITAGSGLLLYHIATHLDRDRYAPTVCVAQKADAPLEQRLAEAGIEVFEAPFTTDARPLVHLRRRCRRAAEAFRARQQGREPWAIWHSFHYLDDYTEPLVARAAGCPNWVFTKKSMSWNRRSWWLRSQLAKGIAAQNRDMIERFFVGRLRKKVSYVPSGVDIERYVPPEVPRTDNPETFRVGCVAHLLPVKGQVHLVEALARWSTRTDAPSPRLVLAGRADDPTYADEIRRRITAHGLEGAVELAGAIDEIPRFLHGLDAFVLPSLGRGRMEGCPVALLEAMSAGLPCIASNIPGSRDVIEHGTSGLLVPPEDPDALAAALEQLRSSADLRHRLGMAARRRCVEQFSTRHEADRYMELYDRILER